jgi:hypothetical protein
MLSLATLKQRIKVHFRTCVNYPRNYVETATMGEHRKMHTHSEDINAYSFDYLNKHMFSELILFSYMHAQM